MKSVGEMKHRITVQYNAGVIDDLGGKTEAWTTLTTVWAAVEPLSSSRQIQAAQVGIYATKKATVRYRPLMPLITATCPGQALRVVYNDTTYNVSGITDLEEKHVFVELTIGEAR